MLAPVLHSLCAAVEIALYAVLVVASVHLVARARWAFKRGLIEAAPPSSAPTQAPFVTIQLPLCNEAAVAEGTIRAAAALSWPRDRFEVQVLDDSDDETKGIVDRVAAELREQGRPVVVQRRADRRGYKSGNLSSGLNTARGEHLLVLDADFRPEPGFLCALESALTAAPALAFCQARWSFRNEGASLLTRLQAAILDALFTVEQAELSERGAPVQFNGTGGIWRRDAIIRAGGWATGDDALTEDLDLSFRAHEVGLRGITLPALAVSTELPESMSSFRTQQARWVRGGALALRTLARRLVSRASGEDARTMLAHLARHARQPLFVLAALRLPVIAWCDVVPVAPAFVGPGVFLLVLLAAGLYLGAARRRLGRSFEGGLRLAPPLLLLSVGLAPALSIAFAGGVLGRTRGGFMRTAKLGEARAPQPRRRDLAALFGICVAAATITALVPFARAHDVVGIVAASFVALGCAWVAS